MTQSNARQISAFFDSRTDAQEAVDRLAGAGIGRKDIQMVEGNEPSGGSAKQGGFFESLSNFFMPDEDKETYAEGLNRGGYLVSARVGSDKYSEAVDILDAEGSVDMDERSNAWRSEGWTGPAAGDGTIEVAEEEMHIGKRDVSHGRVKVRAYTVSEQVAEDVSLESERVDIDRRTVDRPVTDADAAFQDRTVEVEETAQEAVVSKEARIVEEIDVHKDVERHTERVEGDVRHTEVDIDDRRK